MTPLVRWFVAAVALSAAAGVAGTLATLRALHAAEPRDPGELADFEDRFVREFGVPESKRGLVRTILGDYRERRREIEGQAAASVAPRLLQAGREVDDRLRRILPPPQRDAYDRWIARDRQLQGPENPRPGGVSK